MTLHELMVRSWAMDAGLIEDGDYITMGRMQELSHAYQVANADRIIERVI